MYSATTKKGNQLNYCVTTAEQEGQYYVGRCPFAHTAMNHTNRMLSELPSDPEQLNDVMCGPYIQQKRFFVRRVY